MDNQTKLELWLKQRSKSLYKKWLEEKQFQAMKERVENYTKKNNQAR